jgi:uncharacterized membrane protein
MVVEIDMAGASDAGSSGRNLSEHERWASIAAGTSLAIYGLTRLKRRGWLYAALGGYLLRRGATAHCDIYEALGVNTAGLSSDTRAALGGARGTHVLESVTINRPIEELYRFWRNLENLPRFMRHLESVERVTDTISRWRARGPGGAILEWEAEINNEVPNEVIGWRSLENADVVSAGSVNFDRSGRGARVPVHLQYSPPGGKVGASIARLFGKDAETEIREDLRRFKQLVETGEMPTTEGQPRG